MFTKSNLLLLLAVLALMTAACQPIMPEDGGDADGPALTAVEIMLDWVPNTNHTGLYVALEKGFYEAAGLDVTIIQPGETYAEQAVGIGSVPFGISFQESVTFARAEGVPIVSIAAVIQHNTSGFASRTEAGIETPADFVGRTYGSFGSPIEAPMIDLLMSCTGEDISVDDVTFIDTGYAEFLSITERDVDFVWIFYGWDGVNAQMKEVDINVIMLNEWLDCVPDYYTPVIITNETMISENPEVVSAFMGATAEGFDYAIANPEESAGILLAATPESDPALIEASQIWLSANYQDDAAQWGIQSEDVWQGYADWLLENGVLTDEFDGAAAFTNEFLPAE
ncbi:MAG: ABC transporter substrate-binding protein [Chloroflexota bacterium]